MADQPPPSEIGRTWRRAALLALAVIFMAALAWAPNLRQALTDGLSRAESWGYWGLAAVGLAFIPVSLLFLPGSPLTLGAGFVYGVAPAVVAVSAGSTVGATAAFLTGRTLLRDALQRRLAGNPRLALLDRAVGRQGARLVLLLRLSPLVPYNLLNYMLGLTRVRLRDYVWASWLGMLPGTLMYAYLGSAAHSLADLAAGQAPRSAAAQGLFYFGLLATVVVAALVGRLARQALSADPTMTDGDKAGLPS